MRARLVTLTAAQNDRAARSGVSPEVLQQVLAPVTVSTINLASGDRDPLRDSFRYGLAMISGPLVYLGILMSGSMLFQGVLEEKTSRVVEVLAASERPVQMMAGKIIGLGMLGLTQYASWVVGWLFLMTVGRSTLGDSVAMATPLFMLFLLLFTVLGYLMYAAMFAAAASTLSRIEDSATVMMPVIMPLMVPMMFSGFITQNPEGTLARVLSMVPLFAPSTMLPRIVMGHPAAWELLLSIFLLLTTGIGVTWAAGRIYRAGLLSFGGRPALAQVWRYLRS